MKEVVFRWQNQTYRASLGSKITREVLYGKAKTIVEKDGVVLNKGYLTPEGQIINRSEIDYAKLDPAGSIVEEVKTEVDGIPAFLYPSVFDQENELKEVDIKELIGFNVSDVYPIKNIDLMPGLYEAPPFCYRKSYLPKESLLLVKSEGLGFLLVGERKKTALIGQQVSYDLFDVEDEGDEDDELDFTMV